MSGVTIGVVGNPNCGKTTLFNALTGARQKVGNWPGVTVERKTGSYRHAGTNIRVVDLPGVYSLGVTSLTSIDERIARDYILSGDADLIVNIVDASNLERNIYLTTQILEMRVPVVVALNMMDVAHDKGIRIDTAKLAQRLGCPVIPLVAARGEGVEELKQAIETAARERHVSPVALSYTDEIEEAIVDLVPVVAAVAAERRLDARWLALQALEGDEVIHQLFDGVEPDTFAKKQDALAARAGEDVDILIADARYGFANALMRESVRRIGAVGRSMSDRIDRVVLNRVLGIPIFIAIIYLMFMFTVNFASAFIDFFDILAGTVLVDGVSAIMESIGAPPWLIAVIAGGVGGGIQTVATFIPVIGFLYLFLSVLEDSGYMARAAFVMDRFMRGVGLPGKSFIPLIVGFGCNVPAIMATRTLENRRDRIMTVMMAPFMSCGARLPVYALFAAAFFPVGGQNLVFALYLIGIGFAVTTGLVLKNTLLRGETSPFVMELPPYHMPTVKGVLLRTWDRLKAFLFRAGKVIIAVVVVLNFLNSWGTDGSFGNEDSDRSVLAMIGKSATPVLAPLGIDENNWPATVGLFTGVFAKEAVVGTLDALYSAMAEDAAGAGAETAFDFWGGISEAFASIPANLSAMVDTFADPLGLNIGDTAEPEAAAAEQEVALGTFGAMASRFDGAIGAFAYLLAVLLYMPCVAAIAAIHRETGGAWTAFAILWTTGLAYGSSVTAYQIGTFSQHPAGSIAWTIAIAVVFIGVLAALRHLGSRLPQQTAVAAAE
ncbi:MAG: Fe(2+) transporter permease subunit FeoB [Rhodospirillales bacterium]|nr:Fe(2+) transporter permease subunit FeoB [Rhodospirillales bacterium]